MWNESLHCINTEKKPGASFFPFKLTCLILKDTVHPDRLDNVELGAELGRK